MTNLVEWDDFTQNVKDVKKRKVNIVKSQIKTDQFYETFYKILCFKVQTNDKR